MSKLARRSSEGYPGARHGGCEYNDIVGQLAIDRAKSPFGAEQPQSGASANASVYHALVESGDTIMGSSWPTASPDARDAEELLRLALQHPRLRG